MSLKKIQSWFQTLTEKLNKDVAVTQLSEMVHICYFSTWKARS